MILIGLIDSFTDYWSNINATESVERYRSMSATCWSRWHLLVCTSKYSYKYKTEIESLPENCFSCFNLNKFHQSRRKALFFFIFTFFFCILHTNLYLWYSTKFFSLLHLFLILCQKIQQYYNASVLNRMMVILSENWESLFDLTAISLELFVPSLKQTLKDVHDCLRDKEQEMIGSKAMRRKNQDMVSNCLVRVSNFQYTQVTTPSIQKFLESERLIM